MKRQQQLSTWLHGAWGRLCWGMADCRRALIERGLWPAQQHLLVQLDGARFTLLGSRLRPRTEKGRATGLLISEGDCLWGRLDLPEMPRQALGAAVQEALWRVSPLPLEHILPAWNAAPRPQGGWAVEWGLCRRSVALQGMADQALSEDAPVFLALQGRAHPVDGHARNVLVSRQRRLDMLATAALILVALALATPAVMPLVLKRQAVVRAVQHVGELEAQAAPLRPQLEELRNRTSVAQGLQQGMQASVPLAQVMEQLSAHLPDDTWLDRIDVNGSEIRIAGVTGDAGALIATLARQPVFADVRASGASVRDNSLNKERFTFDMRWKRDAGTP